MYQAATVVWNQIAANTKLKSHWAKKVFPLNVEEQATYLDKQREALTAAYGGTIAIAYLTMAPLLMEREAITDFITQTGQLELRGALPEVSTAEEAALLAVLDRPFSEQEAEKLIELLKPLET
jgi:hypothetical protein